MPITKQALHFFGREVKEERPEIGTVPGMDVVHTFQDLAEGVADTNKRPFTFMGSTEVRTPIAAPGTPTRFLTTASNSPLLQAAQQPGPTGWMAGKFLKSSKGALIASAIGAVGLAGMGVMSYLNNAKVAALKEGMEKRAFMAGMRSLAGKARTYAMANGHDIARSARRTYNNIDELTDDRKEELIEQYGALAKIPIGIKEGLDDAATGVNDSLERIGKLASAVGAPQQFNGDPTQSYQAPEMPEPHPNSPEGLENQFGDLGNLKQSLMKGQNAQFNQFYNAQLPTGKAEVEHSLWNS